MCPSNFPKLPTSKLNSQSFWERTNWPKARWWWKIWSQKHKQWFHLIKWLNIYQVWEQIWNDRSNSLSVFNVFFLYFFDVWHHRLPIFYPYSCVIDLHNLIFVYVKCCVHSAFRLKEHPSVRRAFPPVGWHRMVLQAAHGTTVWAWENTVVLWNQIKG